MDMYQTMGIGRIKRVAGLAVFAGALGIAAMLGGQARPVEAATLPALRVEDLRVVESNSGRATAVSVTLRLDRPAPSDKIVSVRVGTADGTAKARTCSTCPGDYLPSIVLTSFPPGTTTRTFLVNIVGDTVREPNETLFVKVLSIENATIADGTGVLTIVDDD